MSLQIVLETHSISEDNERGIASGWNHSRLSVQGRRLARDLGRRRRNDRLAAVFSSDLHRAIETAEIAFAATVTPIFHDWRLRECNYGELNGKPRADLEPTRARYLDVPYPGGESWRQAACRVRSFLDDLSVRWEDSRILVIGHLATRWAFEHHLNGIALEDLIEAPFRWQPGWEYSLS
jgi:broad specificity phosphatase PhoE